MSNPEKSYKGCVVVILELFILCSCNNMKRPDNGHDYDLEPMQSTAIRHSPNCRKCKEIRKQEIIEVVDSMLRAQKSKPSAENLTNNDKNP